MTDVSPAEATILLLSALPSSIQEIAETNLAGASTIIAEEFLTGTPTWFTALPTAVQSYFLSQEAQTGATTSVFSLTFGSSTSSSTSSTSASILDVNASGSSNSAPQAPETSTPTVASSKAPSGGAIAGIVIGSVAALALLVICLLLILHLRELKRQPVPTPQERNTHPTASEKPKAIIVELPTKANITELAG